MTLLVRPGFQFDTDASTYIEAVEAADTQALETATRYAINNFVIGCKQDGIWSAIKASCILAGARTLAGALAPLAGTAPTNNNFVSGDYNRKTGLAGDGSTKYLNSNRNCNSDPQNSIHLAAWISTSATLNNFPQIISAGGSTGASGATHLNADRVSNILFCRNRNSSGATIAGSTSSTTGFVGTTRDNSATYAFRFSKTNVNFSLASQTPFNGNYGVYAGESTGTNLSNARFAFYSIGDSLDLAKLDARVTDLINAFAAAIP
jgi:hypothetical protein